MENGKISITINEKEFEFAKELSIFDALQESREPFDPSSLILMYTHGEDKETVIKNEYRFYTNKGTFDIQLNENPLTKVFIQMVQEGYLNGVRIGWMTKNLISFGKFPMQKYLKDAEIDKSSSRHEKFDVILFFAGFSLNNCHLGIALNEHEAAYGVLPKQASIGRVIRGGHVFSRLKREDLIEKIETRKEISKPILPVDASKMHEMKIRENLEIITFVNVHLIRNIEESLDHFYTVIKNGFFRVSSVTNTFISNASLLTDVKSQNCIFRQGGAVTVRNSGAKKGAVYVYKKNVPFSNDHNVIGKITMGYPLIDHSTEGDKILMRTIPERMDLLGLTQREADKVCQLRSINHIRKGNTSDEAVIIDQDPIGTIKLMETGMVRTFGVAEENITYIELWNESAPKSIRYFREKANFIYHRVGILKILAVSSDFILVSAPQEKKVRIKALDKENSPKTTVRAGTVGCTNGLRRLSGFMGIRLSPSEEYGPTGEQFEGTNIIGSVLSNLDYLKSKNKGDLIFVIEK